MIERSDSPRTLHLALRRPLQSDSAIKKTAKACVTRERSIICLKILFNPTAKPRYITIAACHPIV